MNLADKLQEFNKFHTHANAINKNDKVLLIDGLNSFLRCFAATPTMNDDGEHIGGTIGFLKSIGVMIRQFRPSRCVIIFDGKGGSSRRRKIFSEYKEHRKFMTKLNRTYGSQSKEEEVENQKMQLLSLIGILKNLPVTLISIDNVEADDVIAYLSRLVVERHGEAIIASTDKDFLQLVTDNLKVWNPIKKKLYDIDAILNEYGIHPHNFLMYRVFDGDKSDNINGVKGIGPATLKKYLPELSSADKIPWDHVFAKAENNDDRVAKLILSSKLLLERNDELMKLDEQQMSGTHKIKIVELFDSDIPTLNRLGIIKSLVNLKANSSFSNIDDWINMTFVPLNKFSNT